MKGSYGRITRLGAVGLMLGAPLAATAFPFEYGDIQGQFDTTLSAGATMRVESADPSLIGIANGGTSRSVNTDDGNLNYERGDLVSSTVKATHDLELKYGTYGLFSRASYFYDFTTSNTDKLGPIGQDRLSSDLEFLDLFAYGTFNVWDHELDIRVGKQVINWGESTFISNGINVINAVDVSKLRTPGAEVKEALLPAPILSASFEIADGTSLEAIWILSHDKTRLDPRGSFFSTNDIASDDGNAVYAGFGRRNDQHNAFPVTPEATGGAAIPITRIEDRSIQDKRGQFGLSARYFAESLNNTEFGAYYLHYHSRTPILSLERGEGAFPATLTTPGNTKYFAEYVEGIDLFGLSFNTSAPYGVAVQGEYSYRPNLPTQIATTELVLAALRVANNRDAFFGEDPTTAPTALPGSVDVKAHQLQSTFTKAFGPTLDAEQFVLISEFGASYLDLPDGLLFAGPATSLPAPGSQDLAAGSFQQDGYATRFSWGYRLVSRMDFEDVIGAVQASPRIAFAHDVRGVSSTFNHGTKAVTLGVGFNYLQRWQADVSYTNFFGGRTFSGTDPGTVPPGQSQDFAESANANKDRDFVSVSVSYAF